MEPYKLLDRLELLYDEVAEISDLRRAYIDKDLSSVFRLLPESEYVEDLRKAVLERNFHSLFRLFPFNDVTEDLRKAIVEHNLHSLFRFFPEERNLRKAVINQHYRSIFRLLPEMIWADVYTEDLRKAVTEQNLHSLFRLLPHILEVDVGLEDLRKAVTEQNLHSLFRMYPEQEDLRKAVLEQNLHSIFRLLPETFADNLVTEDFRKAMIERNLHSIFRLFPEQEELRKAVAEQNIHSIFRLVETDDELRKLIVEDNIWKLWPVLDRYIDTQFVNAFKNFFVNKIEIDEDCFSRGQLQSKKWLIRQLQKLNVDLGIVFLCAGWYATLATMIFESGIKVEEIRSFDIDPDCAEIAEIFNKLWLIDKWRFKAITEDIHNINFTTHRWRSWSESKQEYSKWISNSPDTIINTSCEHIRDFTEWYNKIPQGKLVILQTNNYFEIEEHVNCSKTLEDFAAQTPMTNVLYHGELELPKYKRFMRIGYK